MPIRKIIYHEPEGPNWAARAFAKSEALYAAQIREATWGHLAPIQGVKYAGFITFSVAHNDEVNAIDYEFFGPDGEELNGGPWLYDDIYDFLGDFTMTKLCTKGLYQFVGIYWQSKYTGKWVFRGKKHRFGGIYQPSRSLLRKFAKQAA